MSDYHTPVMLTEAVDGLAIHPDGVYLDLTLGGGGHSREILRRMEGGHLLGFDLDEDAAANVPDDGRFVFVHHNFRYLRHFVRYYGFDHVDGILADLGVSSHEFDEAERGFSFRYEAELDMRMNRQAALKATDVLNTYDERALAAVFRDYGEVENASRLAACVVCGRAEKPVVTTADFLGVAADCIPKEREKKYMAKVFQALRIEVNGELDALREMLDAAAAVLCPGGRLVVITYHSLEDRIVKRFLKTGNSEGREERDMIYGGVTSGFELVNRKVIVPSEEEIQANPRGRSAKLRIAARCAQVEK